MNPNSLKVRLLVFVITLCISPIAQAQVEVTVGDLPPVLVDKIAGSGIGSIGSITYQGSDEARGTFVNPDDPEFSISSGIYLCSGSGYLIPGPNNSASASQNNNMPGNPYLNEIANSTTYDAAVLKFKFIPVLDSIVCNFIFGSEEYTTAGGSVFSDLCAIFLIGDAVPGFITNIATVPNTDTLVSIRTINAVINSDFYIDNEGGQAFQYDGFTTLLTAGAAVIPGEEYTMFIGVADADDLFYDSGIFIEEKSLQSYSRAHMISFCFHPDYNPQLNEINCGIIQNDTVYVQMPIGTGVDSMVPSFVISSGAKAYVDGDLQVSGNSVQDFSNPVVYQVEGWDGSIQLWTVVADIPTKVDQDFILPPLLFPNPAQNYVMIRNATNAGITIYDIKGEKVIRTGISMINQRINISSLRNGMYFVKIETDDGHVLVTRLLVNH